MNILILDEARSARRVLRYILAAVNGLNTFEAATPPEARSALQSQQIDAIIADIRLGTSLTDRRGLEFVRAIRDEGNQTSVVIVTSATDVGEIREAMRLGVEDYVLKDELSAQVILPIVRGLQSRLGLAESAAKSGSLPVARRVGTAVIAVTFQTAARSD